MRKLRTFYCIVIDIHNDYSKTKMVLASYTTRRKPKKHRQRQYTKITTHYHFFDTKEEALATAKEWSDTLGISCKEVEDATVELRPLWIHDAGLDEKRYKI